MAKDDDNFDHTTLDGITAVLRVQEHAAQQAPDLRVAARREADALWSGLSDECAKRFGRAPAFESWSQHDEGAAVLLRRAQEAESLFISVPDEMSRGEFHAALLQWANSAVKGWPDAKTYARQERQRLRDMGIPT